MTMDYSAQDVDIPDRVRPGIVVVLVVTVLLATAATYFGALRLFENQAVNVARYQHSLYLRSLNEAIKQHQHLPFVVAKNPLLAERLAQGDAQSLNETLQAFADASGLEAIYIMAPDGQVVATSNFTSPNSFLGQNYGFRPYFQTASDGLRSDYFAIGVTTGRPGYFVAEPLRSETNELIGVVAIKLDISELQSSWEERGEDVLATNADGVVVLSTNPDWLYQTISGLDESRRTEISESRQFAGKLLSPLSWDQIDEDRVELRGQGFYWTSGKTDLVDWTVHYLTPEASDQPHLSGPI